MAIWLLGPPSNIAKNSEQVIENKKKMLTMYCTYLPNMKTGMKWPLFHL